jgi:predicted SprT family Zn-dependent metalloprotease
MNEIDTIMKLRVVFQDLSREFGFRYNDVLHIVISKRLRSSNGNCYFERDRFTQEAKNAVITMSKALLDEFGWETFETTFRHEVAHLANYLLYGGKNHDRTFKILCRKFGGTMNKSLAGYSYADCASSDYVKPIVKWVYTCPCGKEKKMAKRMATKKRGSRNYRCGRCRTYTLDTWTEMRV